MDYSDKFPTFSPKSAQFPNFKIYFDFIIKKKYYSSIH